MINCLFVLGYSVVNGVIKVGLSVIAYKEIWLRFRCTNLFFSGKEHNFRKETYYVVNKHVDPYDYTSLMHYEATAFS